MLEDVLCSGASELGLPSPDAESFRLYFELLKEANSVMNLTAITGEEETALLHFLDSIAPLSFMPLSEMQNGARVIDVGSGAGFPGVPIKIMRRDLRMHFLDAREKRVDFLKTAAERLHFTDAEFLHARAEEAALRLTDSFDFALSRAVANLRILIELCLPFVKIGGYFVAMKSVDSDNEIRESENAVKLLGGAVDRIFDYKLPGDLARRIIVVKKNAATPAGFPRRYKKIQTKPL